MKKSASRAKAKPGPDNNGPGDSAEIVRLRTELADDAIERMYRACLKRWPTINAYVADALANTDAESSRGLMERFVHAVRTNDLGSFPDECRFVTIAFERILAGTEASEALGLDVHKGRQHQPNFHRFMVELVREANEAGYSLIDPNADARVSDALTAYDVAAEIARRRLDVALRPNTVRKFWKERRKLQRP